MQRGPGDLLRRRDTAEGSNTLLVGILVELMIFAGFPFYVIFPVAFSLLPNGFCQLPIGRLLPVACGILPHACNQLPLANCLLSSCLLPIAQCLLHTSYYT